MQITDLYQTKITCSTYNANIDSTDTVITVKLIDFNGNAVTNKSVTLTCDKGYFNKKNSTSISGTTTKSITLTTNSSGEITGTWTASEWGLCTFSANTSSIQTNVSGWKQIYSNGGFTIVSNGILAELICNYTANLTAWQTITTIPYPPAHTQTFPYSMGNTDYTKSFTLETDGKIRSKYTASNVTIEANVLYRLATPL